MDQSATEEAVPLPLRGNSLRVKNKVAVYLCLAGNRRIPSAVIMIMIKVILMAVGVLDPNPIKNPDSFNLGSTKGDSFRCAGGEEVLHLFALRCQVRCHLFLHLIVWGGIFRCG